MDIFHVQFVHYVLKNRRLVTRLLMVRVFFLNKKRKPMKFSKISAQNSSFPIFFINIDTEPVAVLLFIAQNTLEIRVLFPPILNFFKNLSKIFKITLAMFLM
jgi:hypothetical protein